MQKSNLALISICLVTVASISHSDENYDKGFADGFRAGLLAARPGGGVIIGGGNQNVVPDYLAVNVIVGDGQSKTTNFAANGIPLYGEFDVKDIEFWNSLEEAGSSVGWQNYGEQSFVVVPLGKNRENNETAFVGGDQGFLGNIEGNQNDALLKALRGVQIQDQNSILSAPALSVIQN